MSRFLGYFFDSIENKNNYQKNIPKFILTLTVRGRKLPLLSQSFKRTTEYCSVVLGSLFRRVRQVERLFNIVTHYRAALVFERWICAAVPIMPHYVNIAWEDYFLAMSFCLQC